MQGPEEEERQCRGGVEQGDEVGGGGDEAGQEAADHAHVLVHAEGKEVPLVQGGGDAHDGGGHPDDQDLEEERGECATGGGGEHLGTKSLLDTQHVTNLGGGGSRRKQNFSPEPTTKM